MADPAPGPVRARAPHEAQAAVRQAAALAAQLGHGRVTPAHLLRALVGDEQAHLREQADTLLRQLRGDGGRVRLSSEVAAILRRARQQATATGARSPDRSHLLDALAASDTAASRLLRGDDAPGLPGLLDRYGRDRRPTPPTGRAPVPVWTAATDRILRTLERRRRTVPVIIGSRDRGRDAVVEVLAHRLAIGDVPPGLRGHRLVEIDTSALLAEATTPGRLERNLRTVLTDLEAGTTPLLAVIDDLDVLLGTDPVRAALAAVLTAGRIPLVGAAGTWSDADDELGDLVWPLPLPPCPPADAAIVLDELADWYGREEGVRISEAARDAAIRFSMRYLPDRALPGKAVDLVDDAVAGARLGGRSEVDTDDVATIVSEWTSIPLARLLAGEAQQLLRLEERLHERVVGQHEAVVAVASAIRRARAGVADRDRPLGSFLFLGPTGVGKTELARTLALTLFPEESSLVVFDMSEYAEPHAVARLVGAPPGYVGYSQGGQLTDRLRRQPYSVVLLDEIEKAHGDVFNVLLGVLDEGRLTDGQGRMVDVRDAVLIMTSNLGSRHILDPELPHDELHERVMGEVRRAFRPEFLNRVDELVIFHRLDPDHLADIVDIQLDRLRERLAARSLSLTVTPAARRWLVARGHDPAYGARPLRRVIRRHLADRIAVALLEGTVREGQTVAVDTSDGTLTLTADPAPQPGA